VLSLHRLPRTRADASVKPRVRVFHWHALTLAASAVPIALSEPRADWNGSIETQRHQAWPFAVGGIIPVGWEVESSVGSEELAPAPRHLPTAKPDFAKRTPLRVINCVGYISESGLSATRGAWACIN
jgi:hypothetical protein